VILLLLACRPRLSPVLPPQPAEEPAQVQLSGRISEGRFIDGRHDLSIAVPAGWSAEVWPDGGPLRVSITHAETGSRVEVWAFEPHLVRPAPRGTCAWNFIDTGTYREVLRARMVASCTPTDPSAPRISAYLIDRGALTWQLELHVPPEHLSAGRILCEQLLSTLEL
jgi:hypothetical protein